MNTLIERDLYPEISRYLADNEIIVIHGARQTGKTSLMNYIKQSLEGRDGRTFILTLKTLRLFNCAIAELRRQ